MRRAEAVLQAFIIMRSSIRPSLMSPGAVDWSTKTLKRRISFLEIEEEGWDGMLARQKPWEGN